MKSIRNMQQNTQRSSTFFFCLLLLLQFSFSLHCASIDLSETLRFPISFIDFLKKLIWHFVWGKASITDCSWQHSLFLMADSNWRYKIVTDPSTVVCLGFFVDLLELTTDDETFHIPLYFSKKNSPLLRFPYCSVDKCSMLHALESHKTFRISLFQQW